MTDPRASARPTESMTKNEGVDARASSRPARTRRARLRRKARRTASRAKRGATKFADGVDSRLESYTESASERDSSDGWQPTFPGMDDDDNSDMGFPDLDSDGKASLPDLGGGDDAMMPSLWDDDDTRRSRNPLDFDDW